MSQAAVSTPISGYTPWTVVQGAGTGIDITVNYSNTTVSGSTGGGQGHTHSINPPYIQVYAWKRTA